MSEGFEDSPRPVDVVHIDAGHGIRYALVRGTERHFVKDAAGRWMEVAAHVEHGLRVVLVCERLDARSVFAMLPTITRVVRESRARGPQHIGVIIHGPDGERTCALCGKHYPTQYWRIRDHLAAKHGFTPLQVEEACVGKTLRLAA